MGHYVSSSDASILEAPSALVHRRRTSITDLPTELIHHIISFLPESSAGCLAMCNHALLRMLGQQHWRYLKADNPEKEAFLLLLQKDLPEWLYHPCCGRMREVANAYGQPGSRLRDSLRCLHRAGAIDVSERFSIRFHHVHAIMHRYHQNMEAKDGRMHSDAAGVDLSSLTYRHRSRAFKKRYTVQCTPRIVQARSNNQHRTRAKLLLALTYDIPISKTKVPELLAHNLISMCPHMDAVTERTSIQCRLSRPEKPSCAWCGGLRTCEVCFTDFEITSSYKNSIWAWLRPWRYRGLVLKIQTWKDLGECKDMYSSEWWWASRESYETDARVMRILRLGEQCAGAVKAEFDGKQADKTKGVAGTIPAISGGQPRLMVDSYYSRRRACRPLSRCVYRPLFYTPHSSPFMSVLCVRSRC